MSVEKGFFAKVIISEPNLYAYKDSDPYFKGMVRIQEIQNEDDQYSDFLHLEILKVEECIDKKIGKELIFGDYANVDPLGVQIIKNITKKDPEYDECEKLLNEFQKLHKEAPYVITGRLFGECPEFLSLDKKKMHPRYEIMEEITWTPEEVHSLEEAEIWLLTNHPEYYMGSNISQDCPSGDYLGIPVPGVFTWYEQGTFETIENRKMFAEKILEKILELKKSKQNETGDLERDY